MTPTRPPRPTPLAPGRGLTLIELAIGLAILALLAAITVPALSERIARARLTGAAEALASDLAEARFEAARSGRALHLVFDAGTDWCYAIARTPQCGCRQPAPCQLKVARAGDAPGVTLEAAADAHFDPSAPDTAGGGATWRGMRGQHSVEVVLTPLGRTRVCSPTGLRGHAGC